MPVADSLGLIQIGVVQTFDLSVNDIGVCATPQYLLVGGSEVNVTGVVLNAATGEVSFTVTANGPFTFNYERTCNSVSEGVVVVNGTGFNCTPAIITTEPIGAVVCNGGSHIMTVVAIGTDLIYQWRVNGVDILNTNSPTYEATSSGVYSVYISNLCSNVTSADATVTLQSSPTGGSAFPAIFQNVGSSYHKFLILGGTAPFTVSKISGASWIDARVVGNFFEVYGTPTTEDVGSAEYQFRISNDCGFVTAFSFGGQVVQPCLKPFKAMYDGDTLIPKLSSTTQEVLTLGSGPFTYLHTTTGEIVGANNLSTVTVKDTGCKLTLTTVITNACGSITITKEFETKREHIFTHPIEYPCYTEPFSIKAMGDETERFILRTANSITFTAKFGIHQYEISLINNYGTVTNMYLENIEG